ncbi:MULTISPECIES: alpha-galactosidase [unclassified Endozoicomonas]|uniref:alpha-galactosidase n=1 Tax=unclassified Endozoicomonas TaxID=2644528 RepID=UPI003BB5F975
MIAVNNDEQIFHLQTLNSSYVVQVSDAGHLLNLYYGQRLEHRDNLSILDHSYQVKLGSTTAYSSEDERYCLETRKQEVSTSGKGDYRESSLHLIYTDDGSSTSDFVFDRYELNSNKPCLDGLPQTHSPADGDQSLTIVLREKIKPVELHLHYTCFVQQDVICRSIEIINLGSTPVVVDKACSMNLDLSSPAFDALHLTGKWIAEGQLQRHALYKGMFSIGSNRGVSSATHNPFMALAKPDCGETTGDCYGFSLIYSGNHKITTEVSPYDQTRIMLGISDFDFRWSLAEGERFTCPEAVMTFSHQGLGKMSNNFHRIIKTHLIPQPWQNKARPIQANNWEATYFNFDEGKLMKLARKAKDLGVELFVLDDGWFSNRNDETSGLGNYVEDKKKLPGGLARISRKIRQQGLQFGLWVEPEMVSEDSDLFRQHPEWAVISPKRQPSLGRRQLLLDMSNPEVIDYLYQQLADVFRRAEVSYVKWDHNRNFSDVYSNHLPPGQQSGFYHRYVLGLYRLLFKLKEAFGEVLFENCSSGGNRFDLGMTFFMPQTWTSDNTDAYERVAIQQGFSLLYPQCCMSAHVSGHPSHQVLRHTPIESRFNVSCFGLSGYQLDLTRLTTFEEKVIMKQIRFYKQHRTLLQQGDFYRLAIDGGNQQTAWIVVNDDKTEAVAGFFQGLQQANPTLKTLKLPMLNTDGLYQVTSREQFHNIRQFGDLVNEELPVNIKDRGILHGIVANRVLHPSNNETYTLYGDQLQHLGIPLKSQFTGTEMSEQVSHIGDFGTRLFHIRQL